MTPNDFKWIGNMGMILSFISLRVILVSLVFIVLFVFIYRHIHKKYFRGQIVAAIWKRLAGISVIVSLILGMGWAIRNEKITRLLVGFLFFLRLITGVTWTGRDMLLWLVIALFHSSGCSNSARPVWKCLRITLRRP